eukprot:TRINITY_DN51389_c0_g1_i4.p2 TRINITY_DN51389_c0_g1~~TRINITY_DN51389_c0_g1_i4.p2  ORF type:complete len:142 (-),score=36.52 TRINITY_DN51389_c0_g1_i4:212-637(-)
MCIRDRGNTDWFDDMGRHVVRWSTIENWEDTPYANQWTLDLSTLPRGIAFKMDRGELVLTEKEWRRMVKMYADNPGLEAALERHCMYMKSEAQVEFRKLYGLYHGFSKITWRRGRPQHNYTINTADPEQDPPRNTVDVVHR